METCEIDEALYIPISDFKILAGLEIKGSLKTGFLHDLLLGELLRVLFALSFGL